MSDDDILEKIRKKYERLSGVLDERSRRVWASAEAEALGYGGQSIVAKATGLSRMTFYSQSLESPRDYASAPPHTRIRKEGGGRKKLTQREPRLHRRWKLWWSQRLVATQKIHYAGLA